MRVMYVASRFHTNQVPIVRGWIASGDEVLFVSQFAGGMEDYSDISPTILGYSALFGFVNRMYHDVKRDAIENSKIPTYFQAIYGWPSRSKAKDLLRKFKPDVVILRDRCMYTAVFSKLCKKLGICAILYNQSPYCGGETEKSDIAHRLIRNACPQIRMTPVYGKPCDTIATANSNPNDYYIPFVIEEHISPDKKVHYKDNRINILSVGKFEKRKHHKELFEAVRRLNRDDIRLIFVGENTRSAHQEYLDELLDMIKSSGIANQVVIKENLSLSEVYEMYAEADIYVLPSTGEFASISQLEAMSCSLPVIVSDTNGTGDCVTDDENGYRFKDKDFDDLYNKLNLIITDRDKLIQMGDASYRIVQDKYCFAKYKNAIEQIVNNTGEVKR